MSSNRAKTHLPMIAMLGIVILTAFRPGDAPWFFDEARLMNIALKYNATHSHPFGIMLPFTPAPYGLLGARERYGPLPVWIDQIFLHFTHDPIPMFVVRSLVTCSITALSLLWLCSTLEITPWLAVVTMLSPWIWFYNRQLWDNSLLIPLSATTLAAYADFLLKRRPLSLWIGVLCGALMMLIHFMCLALLIPLALHLLIFETKSAKKNVLPLIVILGGVFVISIPYLHYLVLHQGNKVPDWAKGQNGWIFPIFGPQHMTAGDVGYILEESWKRLRPHALSYIWILARTITFVGFVAGYAGMLLGIGRARQSLHENTQSSVINHLCLIGLATFVCQIVIDGLEHVAVEPHYFNGTWIVYTFFVWIGLEASFRFFGHRSVITRLMLPVYGASLATVTLILAYELARNGGTRQEHYSTSISNQLHTAEKMASYTPENVDIQIPEWIQRPEMPAALLQLVWHPPRLQEGHAIVQYRSAFPGDQRFTLVEAPTTQP